PRSRPPEETVRCRTGGVAEALGRRGHAAEESRREVTTATSCVGVRGCRAALAPRSAPGGPNARLTSPDTCSRYGRGSMNPLQNPKGREAHAARTRASGDGGGAGSEDCPACVSEG